MTCATVRAYVWHRTSGAPATTSVWPHLRVVASSCCVRSHFPSLDLSLGASRPVHNNTSSSHFELIIADRRRRSTRTRKRVCPSDASKTHCAFPVAQAIPSCWANRIDRAFGLIYGLAASRQLSTTATIRGTPVHAWITISRACLTIRYFARVCILRDCHLDGHCCCWPDCASVPPHW